MLLGDVRAMLKTLPDDHFDCVVTSPPYWGLRNYGTGKWEGGNPDCEHKRVGTERTPWANGVKGPGNPGKNGTTYANLTKVVGGHCANCEAIYCDSQIGMETTLAEHIAVMVDVFREVRRTLKPTGVCWINYGDCYATAPNGRSAADTKATGNDDRTFRDKPFSTVGPIFVPDYEAGDRRGASGNKGPAGQASQNGRVASGGYLKAKDLCMVPERLFIALQDDGWWIRSKLPWVKRNGMPESITDRPANSLEQIAMLTKSERYWYDAGSIRKAASPSTNSRVAQNVAAQVGSTRASGGKKTNGTMKAVIRKPGVGPKSVEDGRNIKANHSFHGSTNEVLHDRNFRNTDLFFSSIGIPHGLISDADGTPLAIDANPQGFSEAHFATFPIALIEPLIKAGTSESGNCPYCGSPWSRVSEREQVSLRPKSDSIRGHSPSHSRMIGSNPQRGSVACNVVTLGFAPSCDCPEHEPEPARVLDPFGGAGTTALVSATLGRECTLIELNPEYATLARARIEAAFMGKEEGSRHMVKQLGKDKLPFEPGSLFADLDSSAEAAE
jgi:DNA modification methylase